VGRQGPRSLRQAEVVPGAPKTQRTGSSGDRPTTRRSNAMEWVLKLLDDLDDLQAFIHAHARPLKVTLLLLVVFLAILAGVYVLGPRGLQATP